MTRHILVAPAGSRFSPDAGSEDGWIFDIVSGVAAVDGDLRFTCMAERADGPPAKAVRSVAVGHRRLEDLGGLSLPFRLALATRNRDLGDRLHGLQGVHLVHHALPFALGRTFSVLAAAASRRGVPIVVGPLQTPLEWTGADEEGGQLVRGQRSLRRMASAGAAWLWPLARAPLARASAATLRRAHRVVVVGPAAAELVATAGVDPRRIAIIPPPVRSAGRGVAAVRNPGEPLRLVTAGYLIDRKAVDDIITAVGDLARSGLPMVLEIAGDGPAAQRLRRMADRYPDGAIRFHGWLDRAALQELVRASHVYVSMSRAESWGQAAADALASALVVVSAANTGARSMSALGAPITTVPVGDWRRLAAELHGLCAGDPVVLAERGAAGSRWASTTVALPVVARRWSELYCQAMAEGPLRPGTQASTVSRR